MGVKSLLDSIYSFLSAQSQSQLTGNYELYLKVIDTRLVLNITTDFSKGQSEEFLSTKVLLSATV
jgi:hypothetical protein